MNSGNGVPATRRSASPGNIPRNRVLHRTSRSSRSYRMKPSTIVSRAASRVRRWCSCSMARRLRSAKNIEGSTTLSGRKPGMLDEHS
jgi:hypothetical protein